MRVSRIYRLLRLITMLQSGRNWTVDELARELEISRRTVFRDLNVLEMAHVPYYFDREAGTYRINNHFFLPPLNVTLPEALAMLVATRRTASSGALPLARAGERAAMKLESVLPAAVREHLGAVLQRVSIQPPPTARHTGLDDLFDRLVQAVAARRVCRLVYISFYDRKQITLTVEPLALRFVGRAWYLVAWSRRHRQQRTFKLLRIKKLTETDKAFAPRGDVDDHPFGDAWSMIPEGQMHDVHLRFAPAVAGNVAEVNWHRSQRVQWRDDGSIDFHARVDGLGEITWWVLGYGDQVQVLAPKALRDKTLKAAKNMIKLNEQI